MDVVPRHLHGGYHLKLQLPLRLSTPLYSSNPLPELPRSQHGQRAGGGPPEEMHRCGRFQVAPVDILRSGRHPIVRKD